MWESNTDPTVSFGLDLKVYGVFMSGVGDNMAAVLPTAGPREQKAAFRLTATRADGALPKL